MRKLTVSQAFRYVTAEGRAVYAPSLRLQGKWLEKLGFIAGSQVHIEERQGEVILRLIQGGEQA